MTFISGVILPHLLNVTLSRQALGVSSSSSAPWVTPDPQLTSTGQQGDVDVSVLMVAGIGWKVLFVGALLTGFCGNLFITVNVFGDSQMRNTNYFFVLNLVLVDLFVILGVLVVKEVALAVQSESNFLICFPTVWNFVVNYTASNYIMLFLCYEKFVLILLPFRKDKLLR